MIFFSFPHQLDNFLISLPHFSSIVVTDRHTELKRNFATHSDLSAEITDPERHLKPWSEMWLTLFEILHQLSMKTMFEKVKLRQVPVTGSHTRQFDISITSFQFDPFSSPMLTTFVQKKAKIRTYLPQCLIFKKLGTSISCLFRLRYFTVQNQKTIAQ